LFIDEDITVPPAIAKELGFKSVTLLKGLKAAKIYVDKCVYL
jgi:hypothetical protein